jgi:AraC family transcriptional regulator
MRGAHYESYGDWYSRGPLSRYVRASGMAGGAISIIEASQPAGDMSDPPINELVLMRTVSVGIPFDFDLGAGRFSGIESYGDFHLAAPNTASVLQVHADHSVQLFSLTASVCQELLSRERSHVADFGVLHSALFRSELLNAVCQRLIDTIRQPYPASRLFVDGAAMALLGELTLLARHDVRPKPRMDLRDWRVRRTIERIEARLGEDIGLAELAAGVDLSPSRLTSLFRAATGFAPHAWQVRRRIERACDLLRDRRLSVTEIAHRLGFASSQHFATTFKCQTGVSPSTWRGARSV